MTNKYIIHILSFIVFLPLLSHGLEGKDSPIKTTMCDLAQNPEQYMGKMVSVRASIAGNDLQIDDFQEKSCKSYISVVLILPEKVKPSPKFDLVNDDSLKKFFQDAQKGMGVEATFEGRFDAAFVWREHKRIYVGKDKGYGKRNQYGGRIILKKVSDVISLPIHHK